MPTSSRNIYKKSITQECTKMAGKYVTLLTNDNFEEIISNADKPVLDDFYADWCGPCQMLAPIIDEIAEELKDEAIVCKLNVDEARDIAVEFRVATIPTLMVFKNGENTETVIGTRPKDEIIALLK